MNESGEALLSFCALNDVVIMNTTFEKEDIHEHTRQHPGSKRWHCIDYIIMCRSQRKHCCGVSVLRSAECWTHHKLLRAQLKLQVPAKFPCATSRKKFAVSALQDETTRDRFNEAVSRAVEEDWREEVSGKQKWKTIRDSVGKAAENAVGYEKRRQPDWFKESETTLRKCTDKSNNLFSQWLRTHHHSDRQRYVAQRRLVAAEIKRAKKCLV